METEELYGASINPLTRRCLQLQHSNFDMKKLWEDDLGHLKMESYNIGDVNNENKESSN